MVWYRSAVGTSCMKYLPARPKRQIFHVWEHILYPSDFHRREDLGEKVEEVEDIVLRVKHKVDLFRHL